MIFSVADTPQYRLVAVTGDVDGMTAPSLRLACTSPLPIVVNLLSCPYIDSHGLNVLIVQSRSNELILALSPQCRIYRIFAITGLLDEFVIRATLEEALSLALDVPSGSPTPVPRLRSRCDRARCCGLRNRPLRLPSFARAHRRTRVAACRRRYSQSISHLTSASRLIATFPPGRREREALPDGASRANPVPAHGLRRR
jgi:anti-anti-sigma factor